MEYKSNYVLRNHATVTITAIYVSHDEHAFVTAETFPFQTYKPNCLADQDIYFLPRRVIQMPCISHRLDQITFLFT